ncbi:MAG TPA: glycosyltransferase family 9 protein, partial [Tepidisphaeraceae bacterium]|nr:glycosyltransferase family 9 protein [Tepidisphaeraceae bacterium]
TLLEGQKGMHELAIVGEPLPPFDVFCPMMSLPAVFNTTLQTIPADVPYLKPDPTRVEQWRERIAQEPASLKVGLCWAGNAGLKEDAKRSMDLSRLAPLASVPGVRFYSLQKGEAAKQSAPPAMELVDWTAELTDFADTAALIQNLDLVISVDTAVAHLAGAMARPVWVLHRFSPDWRWFLDRPDSPWYPTMRLFRQPKMDDWETPVREMTDELAKLVPVSHHG